MDFRKLGIVVIFLLFITTAGCINPNVNANPSVMTPSPVITPLPTLEAIPIATTPAPTVFSVAPASTPTPAVSFKKSEINQRLWILHSETRMLFSTGGVIV